MGAVPPLSNDFNSAAPPNAAIEKTETIMKCYQHLHFNGFEQGISHLVTSRRALTFLKRLEIFTFSLSKSKIAFGLRRQSPTGGPPRFHHAAPSQSEAEALCATFLHGGGLGSIHHDNRIVQWSSRGWNALRPREELKAYARALRVGVQEGFLPDLFCSRRIWECRGV